MTASELIPVWVTQPSLTLYLSILNADLYLSSAVKYQPKTEQNKLRKHKTDSSAICDLKPCWTKLFLCYRPNLYDMGPWNTISDLLPSIDKGHFANNLVCWPSITLDKSSICLVFHMKHIKPVVILGLTHHMCVCLWRIATDDLSTLQKKKKRKKQNNHNLWRNIFKKYFQCVETSAKTWEMRTEEFLRLFVRVCVCVFLFDCFCVCVCVCVCDSVQGLYTYWKMQGSVQTLPAGCYVTR